MKNGLALIGCSERDLGWMNNRIRSDRYRLGPVLYAPFVLNQHDCPLTQLSEDLAHTLIETFLPIGDEVVAVERQVQ